MKTCYYELLDVSRDASPDEIRRAYRRQALLLHPDKNIDRVEEATQKFSHVQAAYEILSDHEERAWYDSHREQILRDEVPSSSGGFAHHGSSQTGTTAEEILQFFDPSLFAIFDDSEIGFFSIARRLFAQLAEEERDVNDAETLDLPDFGGSKSSWADDIRYFYSTWGAFSTRKSFGWCDLYRMADAQDRRVRRAMEKENKKLRDNGKKEYNDTVKAFVEFIKKRDPRYKQFAGQSEQRKREMAAKVKERAATARAAHRKQFQAHDDPEWAKEARFDEAFWEEEYKPKTRKDKSKDKTDVDEAEKDETAEVEEPTTVPVYDYSESDDNEEKIIIYECIFCKKAFKSEKQLSVHEKSKKHLKVVKDVVRRMKKEDAAMNAATETVSEEDFKDAYEDFDNLEDRVSKLSV
ncbi:hypothetical protein V1512DRAFT_272162 [Lipomyces arxii]|uniref:uncharacterized protein n=1 Tax=Lipomyces arxii TaxID=56418 RepID=UPI0034CF0FA8